MKKVIATLLSLVLAGCGAAQPTPAPSAVTPTPTAEVVSVSSTETPAPAATQIVVSADNQSVIFALNDSSAARTLYSQLPLTIEVENYASNEKIFYPPQKLDTANTPLQGAGGAGTLAYYAPWGDVVLFYGDCGPASGLYALGTAVSGTEQIASLSGTIQMEAYPTEETKMNQISITTGGKTFSATLADSEAARAFAAYLPMTVQMGDLNGQEKFYTLPGNLPANSTERPATIHSGEIYGWSGDTLVLFYKTFPNSYGGYVRLGRVDDPAGLASALGSGNAEVTWSLAQ